MAQPDLPTPSEPESMDEGAPEAPSESGVASSPTPGAPNPDEDSATEGSGGKDPAATLDEMYLTLGHLVAAHDLHRADAEKRLKDLSKTAEDLQKQREEALAEGDHMKYANAVRGLNEVAKIAAILEHDAEDELRAPPQQQDGDSHADARDGDGDPDGNGDEQPLASGEGDMELQRGVADGGQAPDQGLGQ